MSVKLDFSNDFTDFLTNNQSCGLVKVVTQTETFECSGVLLAQHSDVLREYLKEDKELFLTDNKHVRECLSILYGGSVELTEENFQDILKFMVSYDIPSVRDQVLEWMSQNRWNLDNANQLVNGSITVAKAFGDIAKEGLDMKEKILKPSRVFFKQYLVRQIKPNGTDDRYKSLDTAMESVLSEVEDKTELLDALLHQDLIPEYIPSITKLIDQSSYNLFLGRLQANKIANKMSLLSRTQFEELFDKIEDFECMTLKEYKHLNKYKMNINERITIVLSLKFMKGNGSLFSCWKILDENGISLLSNVFTDKSDQFCIIDCILSWLANNQQSSSVQIVQENLSEVIRRLIQKSTRSRCILLKAFCEHHGLLTYAERNDILTEASNDLNFSKVTYSLQGDEIAVEIWYQRYNFGRSCNKCGQFRKPQNNGQNLNTFVFSIKLFKEKIPEVTPADLVSIGQRLGRSPSEFIGCGNVNSLGNYYMYAYAWKRNGAINQRIPLYSDPNEAYKTIRECTNINDRNAYQTGPRAINFSVLLVEKC